MLLLILSTAVFVAFIVLFYWRKRFFSGSVRMASGAKDLLMPGEVFLNVFNTSENGIILLQDSKILRCNKMALKMFGGSANEILGKSPYEFSPEFQPDGTLSEIKGKIHFNKVFSEGVANFDWMHKKVNGGLFLVQVSMTSFETEGKRYATATMSDVTKLRQEETELQDYRLRLEQLVEEKTKNTEQANRELQTLNEELDTTNEELQASNEELSATNEELAFSNKALSKEIEEHKKTQAEKAIIEEKLNQFISQSSEGIVIINHKGIVEDWNKTMAQITGIAKEKAVGCFIWDVTYVMASDPDKADAIRESFKKNTSRFFEEIKKGNRKEMVSESQIKHYDSSHRFIRTTLFPIVTLSENYGGVIISDITQKKAIEAQLEEYRNELEKLLKHRTERLEQLSVRFNEVYTNSSDAITFMDIQDEGRDIKVFDMNPVAKGLFKISDEQLANGISIDELLPEIKINSFKQQVLPKLLSGEPVTFTDERDTGNGYWNSTIYPIKDEAGRIYRTAAFSKNVTAEFEREKMSGILQSAIDSWPFEFWARDNEGRQILQNKFSRKLAGNLMGKRIEDFNLSDEVKNRALLYKQKVLSGECLSVDFETSVSGQKRYVVYKLNPIIANNKIDGYTGLVIDITEQKIAELALIESEKRLNQLLASVTDYKFTVEFKNDRTPETVHSEGCIAVTGYSPADFQNNPYLWYEMVHNDDKPLMKDWSVKVENSMEVEPFEHRIIRKDGTIVWVSNTTVFKKDREGKVVGYDGLISDITKRKKAEIALKENEERFRQITRLTRHLVYDYNLVTGTIQWDGAIEEVSGYTSKEYQNPNFHQWAEMIHPDDKEKILAKWAKSLAELKSFNGQYRYRQKNGEYIWVEEDSYIIVNSESTPVRALGVMKDITGRKKAEEIIRLSEEKYRLLAENIDDVIWKLDVNTLRYTYGSPSIVKLMGYSAEEILDITPEQILMPDSLKDFSVTLPEWKNHYYTTNGQDISRTFEYQIRHKNGFPVWVEINASFITDDFGNIREIVATSRSIEDKKASELVLRESEEKLRTIFETSKDGIILIDREMNILDVNPSALKRSGYKYEEVSGKSIFGFFLNENIPNLIDYLNSMWDNKEVKTYETDTIIKNKGLFPIEISASGMKINEKDVLLLLIRDISERKQHEKELLKSVINTEERERVNFSQEIHDGLGPLLSAAKMYIEWLAEPDSTVDHKKIIPDIKKLMEESTRTVKDISFKLSPHILHNYGILESLKAYAQKVEKTGKTHINIEAEDVGRFDEISETIVYRVTCECINNTLKHAKATNIKIKIYTEDNSLIVNYSDNGKGFNVEKTKKESNGIGLLNMESRLKSINGLFSIQSMPGEGTTVFIKVPVTIKK